MKSRNETVPTTPTLAPAAKPTEPENSVVEADGSTKEDGNESDDTDASSIADGDIAALRLDEGDSCKMVRPCFPSVSRLYTFIQK